MSGALDVGLSRFRRAAPWALIRLTQGTRLTKWFQVSDQSLDTGCAD